MSFPKPAFQALYDAYNDDAESVHDCPSLYTKNPVSVNTCALRMGEALVLATGLAKSRDLITSQTAGAGDGKGFLIGPFGYRGFLCPHGIPRGAIDLAHFLERQWGKPNKTWRGADLVESSVEGSSGLGGSAPSDIGDTPGIVAFEKIPNYSGQGHIDLWTGTGIRGAAYWDAEIISFWALP